MFFIKMKVALTTLPIVVSLAAGTGILARENVDAPGLLIEHKSPVSCLAWSPNGQWVATGTKAGTIRVTEAATGKEVHNFPTGHPITGMAFSPDGKTLAINQVGETMGTWDIASGKRLRLGPFKDFKSDKLAFTPDGQMLVAITDGEYLQWWLDRTTFDFYGMKAPYAVGGCAGIAPDGRVGGMSLTDGSVRIEWVHVRLGDPIRTIILKVGHPHCIAFGPGGSLLAVGNADKGVHLWDLKTEQETKVLTGLPKTAAKLSFSADGRTLAALAADAPSILVWDLANNRTRCKFSHSPGKVMSMALSPDGKSLATVGGDGNVLFIRKVTSRELTHKGTLLELSPKELAELWTDLSNPDFSKVDVAWCKLADAGDNAIPFLRQQIRAVAVPAVDLKYLEKLIAELDSESFAVRETATKELVAVGEPAIGPLQRLLKNRPSLEAQKRAHFALEELKEPGSTPERLQALEALEVLEQVRTPMAIALLKEIERDTLIPQIRIMARQALERIAKLQK
jgi:WD40 repeat protein